MNTAEFRIDELFSPTNGKAKYIKTYVDAHAGNYPVFSASLTEPFGSIDSYDFDGVYLTWVMNGYGGRMQEARGRFSANRDRGVLVPRRPVPPEALTYLRFAYEPLFTGSAVGRRVDGLKNEYTKLYPPDVRDIATSLPVTADGDPDFDAMVDIGRRLQRIETLKQQLGQIEHDLQEAEPRFDVPEPTVRVSLGDTSRFRLSIGTRRLLKHVVEAGKTPIYSANVRVPFGYVDEDPTGVDFRSPSLLWGIDGVFDWNLRAAGAAFIPTDHCGRAEILDDKLDPAYLLHALRARRSEPGFDRVYRANLQNVAAEVEVLVPAGADGAPSRDRQRTLAAEHQAMMDTKQRSLDALEEVLHARLGLQS